MSAGTTIHVGGPEEVMSNVVAKRTVKFHNFESLDTNPKAFTASPTFACHGYNWKMNLYPGGINTVNSEDPGWVSLYLHHVSTEDKPSVKAKYAVEVNSRRRMSTSTKLFNKKRTSWGWGKWLRRNRIISNKLSQDGTLSIQVEIQVPLEPKWSLSSWDPHSQIASRQLGILESGAHSNVVFAVGDERVDAHRFVFLVHSPVIATLIEDSEALEQDLVRIEGISDARYFRTMLRFIYSEDPLVVPEEDLLELNRCQELVVVANRFGIFKLKILLEDNIVKKHLDEFTAIDLLLFADACDCAILYEAAAGTIAANISTFMKQEKWAEVKACSKLLNDILAVNANDQDESFGALYAELEAAGKLDRDGNRAMLKRRLNQDDDDIASPPQKRARNT